MIIEVKTDNHVAGSAELIDDVQATVEQALNRFGEHLTRVEVHLKDVNSHKSGSNDKYCTLEARPAGMQPIAVTHSASNLEQALDGAVKKLRTTLDRTFGKLSDHKGHTSSSGEPT